MSLREEVATWTSEAFRTLEIAQQISTSAQQSLDSTSETLTGTIPARIKEAVADYEAASKSYSSLVSITKNVQDSVLQRTDGHEKKVDGILQPALRDLDGVLATLHAISVPSFLVKRDPQDQKMAYSLDEFVALEEITTLKAKIDIYLSNCEKVSSLLRKRSSVFQRESASKVAEYKNLHFIFEAKVLPVKSLMKYASLDPLQIKTPDELVGTLLKENNALGSELTVLLEMLTRHYDQCALASSLLKNNQAEEVDTDVLRNDALELSAVLKELRAIFDIISHNERRALGFLESKLAGFADFSARCRSFSEWYSQFEKNDVTELLLLVVHSMKVYGRSSYSGKTVADFGKKPAKHSDEVSPIDEFANVVRGLSDHYRQFCSVYQAQYLSELHYEQFVYPRKFLKLLDDYLNGQLLELEDEERERRREWLRKYGSYIPAEFRLPGEADQPRVVQVVSEGLDHLESSSAHEDEDRLVSLLRETRISQGK